MAESLAPSFTAADHAAQLARRAASSWVVAGACWMFAVLSWLLLLRKANLEGGLDARVIWLGIHAFVVGQPIYFRSGSFIQFVFPPSAALILAPLGMMPSATSRMVFAVAQAGGISLACVIAVLIAGRLQRVTLPLAVLAGSLLLPARNSVFQGNIDGVIVGLELLMILAAARNRWGWAAIAFGFSLALKPLLLPVVLLFVLTRKWRPLLASLAIPIGLSAIVVLVNSNALHFVTQVMPYLWGGQSPDEQNDSVSLAGAAYYLHIPILLTMAIRVALGVAAMVLLLAYWQQSRSEDVGRRLAVAASIIMLAVLITFSYAWAHYILFLIPIVPLYRAKGSVVNGWLTLVAFYLLFFPDNSLWARVLGEGSQLRLTFGLLLLMLALGRSIWLTTKFERPAQFAQLHM